MTKYPVRDSRELSVSARKEGFRLTDLSVVSTVPACTSLSDRSTFIPRYDRSSRENTDAEDIVPNKSPAVMKVIILSGPLLLVTQRKLSA